MSTIKTTNITHGSNSGTANMVLASDGDITFAKKPALGRQILEQFYSPCDGSVIATAQCNVTMPTVTGVQVMTTRFADITGFSIAYTPPSGTTNVIYEFRFQGLQHVDDDPFLKLKFFIDSDEVTDARTTYGGAYLEGQHSFKWGINIGGSAATATGRQASWGSSKTLKLSGRESHADQEVKLHMNLRWEGASNEQFHRPHLGITAIG